MRNSPLYKSTFRSGINSLLFPPTPSYLESKGIFNKFGNLTDLQSCWCFIQMGVYLIKDILPGIKAQNQFWNEKTNYFFRIRNEWRQKRTLVNIQRVQPLVCVFVCAFVRVWESVSQEHFIHFKCFFTVCFLSVFADFCFHYYSLNSWNNIESSLTLSEKNK